MSDSALAATGWSPGWRLDDFRRAYASGMSVVEVMTDVLAALGGAPGGVLIGEPLSASALAEALRLDRAGPIGLPLFGIPVVVKDNIDVAAAATTAACPGFAYTATADAAVVARLREAGAVVVAKTNMDQFATGLVGTRSPYGVPVNTVDPALVPGGSSSGSAISVALGLVPVALGTDTAGSGRVPAALNGIVGVKPTVGWASGRGIVPAMRRFDCPTVFAHSVADATQVMGCIVGHDPQDPFSRRGAPRRPGGSGVVGAPVDPPAGAGVAPEVWEGFERSLARLGELGVSVDRFDPGELDAFLECGRMLYGTALVAERFAAVGHAVENLVPGLDPVVFGIISRAGDWTSADAYQAEYELQGFRRAIEGFWERFDVLALPTVPRLITRAEVAAEPLLANERLGRLTTFVNLLDLCAVVAPLRSTGVEEAGPPPSLQLVAPAWSDSIVADIANTFEAGVRVDATDTLASAASHSIVVVGAHLNGQPLHHQLTERRARFVAATTTSPKYRLHALSGTVPPKPGLVRDEKDGATVEVEVWSLDDEAFGTFVRGVPPPLCIGTVELADGSWHKGFLCEPIALPASEDITSFGGWRAYLTSRSG